MKKPIICVAILSGISAWGADPAPYTPEFSTAGIFSEEGSPREVRDFNPGWRFLKGDTEGAEHPSFDDAEWNLVNLPDGMEVLPIDASGCMNYQGPAWYRKHFTLPPELKGKRVFLHFEGIMGKSKVWINGKLASEHFGGFLPIHIDATDYLIGSGKENVVAVRADNSDDPTYPPGKPQAGMDFTYAGGIYRDVWLIATDPVHVSNANGVEVVAGGGVFFHTDRLTETEAQTSAKVHVVNSMGKAVDLVVQTRLVDAQGRPVAECRSPVRLPANGSASVLNAMEIAHPETWSPDHPSLYDLVVSVETGKGETLDSLRMRVGVRTVELRGPDGFYLNGKRFDEKLIGANRHQDFAYIGNALPNNLHWRDAKKLRDAGLRIIRVAHYPQDPAFMDACDELGLFVIVATPGWHHYQEGEFHERSLSDIRQMVRRDRSRACLFGWEPVLNETPFPESYARDATRCIKEEYPYPDRIMGCDHWSEGVTEYSLMYGGSHIDMETINHHRWKDGPYAADYLPKVLEHYKKSSFFIREFGDNVNDWVAQDSTSRIRKDWGEAAQLVQFNHYDGKIKSMMGQGRQDIGGCLWHPFDHQRGVHPDPFLGGILDAARQPKYSYWIFMAQRNPETKIDHVASGPFVKVLHEVAAASGSDVQVASNCDEVRLTVNGKPAGSQSTIDPKMPFYHKALTFTNAYDFMDQKSLLREKKHDQAAIIAEGLISGKVVCATTNQYVGRRSRIVLKADSSGTVLVADGSDIMVVVATVCDERGNVKRYGENTLKLEVSGAGSLVGDGTDGMLNINPQVTKWGEAILLVRAGSKPGKIIIKARDSFDRPTSAEPAELVIETVAPRLRPLYSEQPEENRTVSSMGTGPEDAEVIKAKLRETEKELLHLRQKETARGQEGFETGQ